MTTKPKPASVRSVMKLVDHFAVGLAEAEAGGEGWNHRKARDAVVRELRRLARQKGKR